jgi:hypothetical protein
VDEVPHRLVIDFETATGKLSHKPAQGKIFFLNPEKQKGAVLTGDCFRLVPADLAVQNAAGLPEPANPIDDRADSHGKLRGRLAP